MLICISNKYLFAFTIENESIRNTRLYMFYTEEYNGLIILFFETPFF